MDIKDKTNLDEAACFLSQHCSCKMYDSAAASGGNHLRLLVKDRLLSWRDAESHLWRKILDFLSSGHLCRDYMWWWRTMDHQASVPRYRVTTPTRFSFYGSWIHDDRLQFKTQIFAVPEVVCTNQREYNVRWWKVWWNQRLIMGDTVQYECANGYKSPDGSNLAKCTRDGWKPKPLCQGIVNMLGFFHSSQEVERLFLISRSAISSKCKELL